MKRKQVSSPLEAKGGLPEGGGIFRPSGGGGSSRPGLFGSVEKSIQERGGFPMRKGVPMKSPMQKRAEERASKQGEPDYAKREARAKKFKVGSYAK